MRRRFLKFLTITFNILSLFSCNKNIKNINISENSYIINLNSNIVHKTTCQTIPKMSEKNKIISNKSIEEILNEGYVACKDCKPDRDALYVTSIEINEFERILHDEFGFGKDYTDKVLKCLSNLYEGVNYAQKSTYNSTIEYHRLLASCVYQNLKTWSLIGGLYPSELSVKTNLREDFNHLKLNDKSYFDDDAINNLYDSIREQHNILSNGDNDFAHMSATISVYAYSSPVRYIAGKVSRKYNGISDVKLQSGFIGDICGVNGAKPSMNADDYAADLDAVNLYNRYENNRNKNIYVIFVEYYQELKEKRINRAREFLDNISIEEINQYRLVYLSFLLDEKGFGYDVDNEDYINRMKYFDNFVAHLINYDEYFVACKYFNYHEY